MSEASIFEIPATKADGSDGRRLLIIPDVSAFFENSEVQHWTAERIKEVMEWSNIRPGIYWDDIVIASPERTFEQYYGQNFKDTWNTWANTNGLRVHLTHARGHDEHDEWFGVGPDDKSVLIRFYPQQYFDYLTDCSITAISGLTDEAWHSGNWLEELGSAHVWNAIIREVFGYVDDQGWYGHYGLTSRPIIDRFVSGETRIPTDVDNDGSNAIAEVVILERVGGELKARAFVVPRSFDPMGHLP